MIALLSLTLSLAPGPDSLDWPGYEVLEPVVVEALTERWQVPAADLVLEWGHVRGEWVPGPDARVELKGTGRGGFWIVSVEEGSESLAVRLRAGTRALTLVAARDLSRGSVLTEEDQVWELREEWGPPAAAPSAVEPGWTIRRVVRAGEVLEPPAVTPPDAVTSGAPVTVEYVTGRVALTLPGTALGTVPVGGTVYVRTETGERLQGQAVGPGRVRVSSSR